MVTKKKVARKPAKVTARPGADSGATATATATAPPREAIERRAYELYLARDGKGGDPQSDWLQAEKELLEQN